MNKFLFKSTDADFQKLFQLLEMIQKNVLYMTYRTDSVLKILNKTVIDKDLQSQVDEYFDETSHQTDSEDKEPD